MKGHRDLLQPRMMRLVMAVPRVLRAQEQMPVGKEEGEGQEGSDDPEKGAHGGIRASSACNPGAAAGTCPSSPC